MSRFFLCVLCAMALTGAAIAGQDEQQPAAKPSTAAPRAANKQETPKPAASSGEQPHRLGQLANVRLEVTITDQRATGQPMTKTVALVLADRTNGRIRTTGEVPVPVKMGPGDANTSYHMRTVVLNVDANPELTRDGRVRAFVTLEYRPTGGETTGGEQLPPTISETFTVVLEDGKPLVVSQSADPNTDRRVRVEVKATILK